MDHKAVSLLFSGGADSTLSAAILTERFARIELVTFKHYATWRVRSSGESAGRLKRAFPAADFRHVYLNSSPLFFRLQKRILDDISEYPFLNHYFCGACKLAMHSCLIAYNLRNGIRAAASGASRLMPMFPDQTEGGSQAVKELYAAYGMTYENPVFDLTEVDKKAVQRGLLAEKHLKSAHKTDFSRISDVIVPIRNAFDNIQGFCFFIGAIDPYLSVAAREYTLREISDLSRDYYRKTIDEVCRPWIEDRKGEVA